MSRVASREIAFKLIFEYCINKEYNEFTLNTYLQEDDIDKNYLTNIYNGVIEHFEELKQEISEKSKSFSVDRIFKIDLSLLLLALYEIKYVKEIPAVVSVNEVLNLAKVYSTEKSTSFINGILSNFMGDK